MTVHADQAVVIALACHTGDRTDAEHEALLRVADRLDRDRNRYTSSNGRFAWGLTRTACTAPQHTGTGCPTCRTQEGRQLLVPPFTASAKREALVDEAGWSIAAAIVDQTRETTS